MGNGQFNKFGGELCFCFFSPRRRACLASQQPGELRDVWVAEEFLHLAHDSEVKLRAFLVFVALAFLSRNYVFFPLSSFGKALQLSCYVSGSGVSPPLATLAAVFRLRPTYTLFFSNKRSTNSRIQSVSRQL